MPRRMRCAPQHVSTIFRALHRFKDPLQSTEFRTLRTIFVFIRGTRKPGGGSGVDGRDEGLCASSKRYPRSQLPDEVPSTSLRARVLFRRENMSPRDTLRLGKSTPENGHKTTKPATSMKRTAGFADRFTQASVSIIRPRHAPPRPNRTVPPTRSSRRHPLRTGLKG